MIAPYTENQKVRIVNNIVTACEDIELLNKPAYKYLSLCSGFIAHYNLYGFIGYYSGNDLREDILSNQRYNQWSNFKVGDEWYEYNMSKKDIYNRVCRKLLGV